MSPAPTNRQPSVSNRAQALRPSLASRQATRPQPVSSRAMVAQQGLRTVPVPLRPISQRVQAVAAPTVGQRLLQAGSVAAKTYADYTVGFYEGVGDSLKSTWGFIAHDAWQVKTWTEMGTTLVAVSLMSPQGGTPIGGQLTARWLDQHLGTQFAPRQIQIVMALDQTFQDMPHWQAQQWGKVVGRVAGDILTTKGAGAAAKGAVTGVNALNKVAAVRYLAKYPSYAEAFSDVKGFNIGLGQRSFKVQEALQWAKKGRWMSNQQLGSSAETVVKMALDYPGSLNKASVRWSVRRFGVYVEGTVAPQANPLGGGGHQLFRVMGKEGFYVEVPYK